MTAQNRLGPRLRALRKEKKLTQDELASRIGRSVDAISNIERGKSLPSFETIELLCEALTIPIKTLFDFEGEQLPPRKAALIEELISLGRRLRTSDLELAVEQVKAILRLRP